MLIPRDYQLGAVASVFKYFETKKGNPLILMPTGTGKSVVIAMLVQAIMQWPGQRVMMVTHVKELIQQNYDKLMAAWPDAPAGIFSSGLGQKDRFKPITFAGIGSVAKRAHEFGKVDILFIDECHLISPKDETQYRKFIKALQTINPKMKIIGLTATGWRLGFGKLTNDGGLFTDVAFDMTTMACFNWLIEEGYLAMLHPKNTTFLLETKDVKTTAGEFNQHELQLAVDKIDITRKALRETMEYGHDRNSWLIFAAGVEHAVHVAAELTNMGIECGVVHSNMADGQRDAVIADWKSGNLRAIANNGILTTGIDHPMCDFIVMLRPTKSSVLWVQMLGRGTRPVYAEGFDLTTRDGRNAAIAAGPKARGCLCLDFANNTKTLGPINDPRIPGEKLKGGPGEAPAKLCMSCGIWNHPSVRNCSFCGSEFTFAVKLRDTADDKALIKSDVPIVETFAIDMITFDKHIKRSDGARSMKVTYFCGLKHFTEWVPLEAMGSVRGIAKRWWNQRTTVEMPDDVDDAIAMSGQLKVSTHLRVWVNKQYPEILAHCFDGTNFGKEPPSTKQVRVSNAAPTTQTSWNQKVVAPFQMSAADVAKRDATRAAARAAISDDDIPF